MSQRPKPRLSTIKPDRHIDKRQLEVSVYMLTCTVRGNVYRFPKQRLLDLLNSVLVGGLRAYFDFLPVTDATFYYPFGIETRTKFALLNKDNIFFVSGESEETELDIKGAYRLSPTLGKRGTFTQIHMPSYTLIGQLHANRGQRLSDVPTLQL